MDARITGAGGSVKDWAGGLQEVSTCIEFVLGIIDETDDIVPILAGFVLLVEIDFASALDSGSVLIGDDFDVRVLWVARVGCRTTASSSVSSRTRRPMGIIPTQVIKSFMRVGSNDFPAFPNMNPSTLAGDIGSRRYTRDDVIAS